MKNQRRYLPHKDNLVVTSSDFVWQLVRSLSKKEIEWFYRVASINQNRNPKEEAFAYIELFQALREMSIYDESILKEAFPVSNFSELKGRIRNVIYKAIAFYGQTPQKEQYNLTHQIQWLIDKDFYHISHSLIWKQSFY